MSGEGAHRPSRRGALAGGLALAAAPLAAPLAAWAQPAAGPPTPTPSLDAIARRRGLRFGACISAGSPEGGSISNPAYAAVVAGECGVVVAENSMKWQALQPTPGPERWAPADRVVGWARTHGLQVRGHNLLWYNPKWLPDWVNAYDFGPRPAMAAEKLLVDHVTATCRHFGPGLTSWDVVNEAVDPATGALRETVFTRALGDRAVAIAFHAARAALPTTKLVYNDYMEWEAGNARHRDGVLRLLERLKRDGAPVDALGLQSHLGGDSDLPSVPGRPQPREWRAFLESATGMGLGLLVTELDVNDRTLPGPVAERDADAAAYVKDYLDLTLSFPQVSDVLCWGMVDRFSWLRQRTPRADGLAKRPCPYDDAYRPKPMRAAIAAALDAAPPR